MGKFRVDNLCSKFAIRVGANCINAASSLTIQDVLIKWENMMEIYQNADFGVSLGSGIMDWKAVACVCNGCHFWIGITQHLKEKTIHVIFDG